MLEAKISKTASRRRINILLVLGALICSFSGAVNTPVFADSSVEAFDSALAERLTNQHFRKGRFDESALIASKLVQHHEKHDDKSRLIDALEQLSKAEAALGDYQSAKTNLEKALILAQSSDDRVRTASILGALGNIAIALGPSAQAERYLKKAVTLLQDVNAPDMKAIILNNLGNYYAFQGDNPQAIHHYRESAVLARQAQNKDLTARALANHANILSKDQQSAAIQILVDKTLDVIQDLDDSHSKAYLLINLARTLNRVKGGSEDLLKNRLSAFELLMKARDMAAKIQNSQAESYAWGYIGELYERTGRYREALRLTFKAIFYAQQTGSGSDYLLFSWFWQAARQYQALADRESAIQYYRQAIDILQKLRYQMAIAYLPKEKSFRETSGAIYFQLVDLLLRKADETKESQQLDKLLKESRDTLELLKAAEIRNYFDDECVDAYQAKGKKIEQISPSAVVIYPILLDDRLEILLNFPGDRMRRYHVSVDSAELNRVARQFRLLLEKRTTYQYREPAQKLHRWLVEPYLSDLTGLGINTLVFVPDSVLNSVPMAALFDGKQHLISKFAVVSTPGIELTDPQPLRREKLNVIAAGLSEPVGGFSALKHVSGELEAIQKLHGGEVLLNKEFLKSRLESALYNPELNVLHISTHGEFRSNAKDSYLLTYNGKLSLDQLSKYVGLFKFRETPLELLVLSACETAQGDDRAALGLSGIAIKAGARSAIGSLWKVNDAATSELITEFYRQLQAPDASRATALQQAQLKLEGDLRYRHPGYWSAFLLLNSWL